MWYWLEDGMRRIGGVSACCVLAGVVSAQAADLPVKAIPQPVSAYNWSGFYAGANAGAAWDRGLFDPAQFALEPNVFTDVSGAFTGTPGILVIIPGTILLPVSVTRQSNNASFIGGGQFGYNWQAGRFVYGLEADVRGTNTSGNYTGALSQTFAGVGATSVTRSLTANIALDRSWETSFRGRVGYTWDRLLVFGTAGVSVTSLETRTAFTAVTALGPGLAAVPGLPNASGTTMNSDRQTLTGSTFGVGFEYGLTNSWIAGAEYRFTHYGRGTFNLGTTPAGPIPPTLPGPATISLDSQQVTARISYLFGRP
jgi:outer membrane immunogenic protein